MVENTINFIKTWNYDICTDTEWKIPITYIYTYFVILTQYIQYRNTVLYTIIFRYSGYSVDTYAINQNLE
jgi:hypothetical protein